MASPAGEGRQDHHEVHSQGNNLLDFTLVHPPVLRDITEPLDPDVVAEPPLSLASRLSTSGYSTKVTTFPVYPPSPLASVYPSSSFASSSVFSSQYALDAASSTSSLSLESHHRCEKQVKLGGPIPGTMSTMTSTAMGAQISETMQPPTAYTETVDQDTVTRPGTSSNSTTSSDCCSKIDAITAKYPISPYSQLPLSITLDSLALSTIAAIALVLLHFGNLLLIELAVAAAVPALWVHNDYKNFLRLGPGGTPSTPRGYLKLKWLGLFILTDPFTAPPTPPELVPSGGIFPRRDTRLPFRVGPRPTVAGLAPQRQTDQLGSEEHYAALSRLLAALPERLPSKFSIAKSTLEKHGLALYSTSPVYKLTRGEICHVHASDHSLHLSLHPDDAREVLEKQWGERHPLGSVSRFGEMPIAPYFTMIYAPQDDEQFAAVCRIIEAAIWFVSMEDVALDVKMHT